MKKVAFLRMVFVGNAQNVKKVLTFRKPRFIIADINDERRQKREFVSGAFSIAGEYVMKEKEELVWM